MPTFRDLTGFAEGAQPKKSAAPIFRRMLASHERSLLAARDHTDCERQGPTRMTNLRWLVRTCEAPQSGRDR